MENQMEEKSENGTESVGFIVAYWDTKIIVPDS